MTKAKTHFLISRTDGIGDAILTLPLAGALKREFPESKITFLGRNYTKAIVNACTHVDAFVSFDEIEGELTSELEKLKVDTIFEVFPRPTIAHAAKAAKIPTRIGTARRWYMLKNVNKPLFYSRKSSELHESQLNLKMLSALKVKASFSLGEIKALFGLQAKPLSQDLQAPLQPEKIKLILHPLSHGSALEWPCSAFADLIRLLPQERYQILITGTEKERLQMADQLPWDQENVLDLSGKLSLEALFSLCNAADALIAASTGPLHMAAALGTVALGLYSPKQPIWPKRWMPIGENADYLVCDEHPEDGRLPFTAQEVSLKLDDLLSAKERKRR